MSQINQLLLSKWNNKFRDFGLSMTDLGRNNNVGSFDSYFFLKRELEYNTYKKWRQAKRDGMIRHCIIHDRKFYDYIVNKHYDTFEDWLYSLKASYTDVLYGSNRIHKGIKPNYVTLCRLLEKLNYKYVIPPLGTDIYETMNPEEDTEEDTDMPSLIPLDPGNFQDVNIPEMKSLPSEDEFGDILTQLNLPEPFKQLPLHGRKCLVQRSDGTIIVSRFMDYKFFGLSESEPSRVFLNVPEPEKFMNGMYFKVSELPLGWKVFVKKHSGEFDEIQNLVHNN